MAMMKTETPIHPPANCKHFMVAMRDISLTKVSVALYRTKQINTAGRDEKKSAS